METHPPILPQSWSRMLENVEQALAKAETELTLPEVPAEAVEAKAAERASRWQAELRRLAGLGQQLQARAQQAEEKAHGLDDALGQTEQSLRGWLAQAATIRGQLAKLTSTSL